MIRQHDFALFNAAESDGASAGGALAGEDVGDDVGVDVDISAPADWRAGLTAETRAELDATGFKSPDQFATGYLELQRKLGTSISIPHAESSPEDRAAFLDRLSQIEGVAPLPLEDDPAATEAFYAKLGKPATVAGYTPPEFDRESAVQALGEEQADFYLQERGQLVGHFLEVFHAANLTQAQASMILGAVNEMDAAQIAEVQNGQSETRGLLTKHLGDDQQIESARVLVDQMAEKLFGERSDLRDQFSAEMDVKGRPAHFWLLQQAARATLEDSGLSGQASASSAQTQFDLEQELSAITGNISHAYYTGRRGEPEHDSAVAKVMQLHEQIGRFRGDPEFLPR